MTPASPTGAQEPRRRRSPIRWLSVLVVIALVAVGSFWSGVSIATARAACRFPTGTPAAPPAPNGEPGDTVRLLVAAINNGKDASALFADDPRAQSFLRPGLLDPSYIGNICQLTVTEYGQVSYGSFPNGANVPLVMQWTIKKPNDDQQPNRPYLAVGVVHAANGVWLIQDLGDG